MRNKEEAESQHNEDQCPFKEDVVTPKMTLESVMSLKISGFFLRKMETSDKSKGTQYNDMSRSPGRGIMINSMMAKDFPFFQKMSA